MSETENTSDILGVDEIKFYLDDLYTGINDEQIDSDLALLEVLAQMFQEDYKGNLGKSLPNALEELLAIYTLSNKLAIYIDLQLAVDGLNEDIARKSSIIYERWINIAAEYLDFFDRELGEMEEEDFNRHLQNSDICIKNKSFLEAVRGSYGFFLTEEAERAILMRSTFGTEEWAAMSEETFQNIKVRVRAKAVKDWELWGKSLSLSDAMALAYGVEDRGLRYEILKAANHQIKKGLVPVVTRGLNVCAAEKNLEDYERGYEHIMSSSNMENSLSDDVVEALHTAALTAGSKIARRFYKLLSVYFSDNSLVWSDRNVVPVAIGHESKLIPWDEAVEIVRQAYGQFSLTLVSMIDHVLNNGWIDAAPREGKYAGAYNISSVFPEGTRSYTLINYRGNIVDVMTLAHELGHAVHGMLAGDAQGPLQQNVAVAYAETASIFGEMLTFRYLLEHTQTDQDRLELLMGKMHDFLSLVIQQIVHSNFEQRFHEARLEGKLTSQEITMLWLESHIEMYGDEGEVFYYGGMEYGWATVSHFFTPFYTHAYAFGELLTQSLFAIKDELGDKFEELYLNLLKAGSTEEMSDLLAPFGLDPTEPEFWEKAIENSAGQWLSEIEKLSADLGIKV